MYKEPKSEWLQINQEQCNQYAKRKLFFLFRIPCPTKVSNKCQGGIKIFSDM